MGTYIVRRILWLFVVLFVVSLITFVMEHSVPGGPFDKEKKLSSDIQANLNAKYHLDDPLWQQYLGYLNDVIIPRVSTGKGAPPSVTEDYLIDFTVGGAHFQWMNFGPTYSSRSRSVSDIFRQQLPVSGQLGVLALSIAIAIGIPLGIFAALKQNTYWDYIGMSVAIFGVSVPVIVLGPLLIWIFAVSLDWFPPTGWGSWNQMVLPSFALGLGSSAIIARLTRAALLQVVREDYIRTARAKGLQERAIIIRHALKNSMIPVITILGPLFAALVTGTFVTETIFGIPGMGKYFVTSIGNRDYPVIMGTILLYAVFLVLANLFVDIIYAWLDPRIKYT